MQRDITKFLKTAKRNSSFATMQLIYTEGSLNWHCNIKFIIINIGRGYDNNIK